MKKSLIVVLSIAVVMLFAASAFALHAVKGQEYTPSLVKSGASQLTLGGEIRIRGNMSKNTDFDNDAQDTEQKYDQRARLSVKGDVSANTFGFIELETNSGSDTASSTDTYTWDNGNNKKGAMNIRQAFISHQTDALGMLAGFKAGHLLLALGNNLFLDHSKNGDDAFILWTSAGPGEVSFISAKLAEGDTKQNDDWDANVLSLVMPLNSVNLSADVSYLRNHDKSTYDKGERFINAGLRVDADLKAVMLMADAEFQTGKAKEDAAGNELKYKGYAFMGGVVVNAGPVAIKGKGAYGSGDKADTAEKDEGFRTFLTDNQYYTFVTEYTVPAGSGVTHTGLENTWYLNLGVSAKPMADLKVSADYYYLRAVRAVAINSATDDSKKLGHEVDAKIEYQIDSNLAYYVEAGYLFAGDAYDRYDSAKGKNVDADDPYRVRHGILLKF